MYMLELKLCGSSDEKETYVKSCSLFSVQENKKK